MREVLSNIPGKCTGTQIAPVITAAGNKTGKVFS